jgi:hypothetical protein
MPRNSRNFAADFERKGIKEKFDKRKLEREGGTKVRT